MKYRAHHRLTPWFADRMAECAARAELATIDCVVPVPMHWLKRRLRGADTVGSLARTLAARLRRPCEPGALERRTWSPSQTSSTASERFRNVAEAFRARRGLRGTVALVDDVVTTGATAHACAEALRGTGAARVIVLAAAVTPAS